MPIREHFPKADEQYEGGKSDGWEFRILFAGSTLDASLNMIKEFLKEEGYDDIPLPADANELKIFAKAARKAQLQLFHELGYHHNPIKILFPIDRTKQKTTLILCLYNENTPDHLLRFHGLTK